jgi:hypothetical protein
VFALIFWGVLVALLAGVAIKFALDKLSGGEYSISWKAFCVGAVAIVLVVAPVTSSVGTKIAQSNQLNGFHEYWNGYELAADWHKTSCSRDGPCYHEYDCDPYLVYKTRIVDDGNGKSHTETYTETEYHSCPYTDEEWSFVVKTTLGNYTIRSHGLPDDPYAHKWRKHHGIPESLVKSAGAGVPMFWQQVADRVKQGKPGPVTAVREYTNYILASQSTILRKYSGAVKQYQADKLLPELETGVENFYNAHKVYGVGFKPSSRWQNAAMRFNAALGSDLQGDLHVVIVRDRKVNNPDEYLGALMAHWLSPKLGKNALSKNGIVVVLGTEDGKTVTWARAETGMPRGNEAMLQQMKSELPGTSLTPEALLGHPRGEFAKKNGKQYVRTVHGATGALEQIVWGPHKFDRVCMTCNDKGDSGSSYSYLKDEIQPTGTQKFWIVFTTFFVSLLIWGALGYFGTIAVSAWKQRDTHKEPWRF